MARKSIGDLHATVTADAVQFVNEFKRADNEAKRASASIKKTLSQQFGDELNKTGKKFALGFLGAAALGAVIGQVKDVSRSIDSIPGVPAETIESIRTMNYAFAQTGKEVDRATAKIIGGIAKATAYAGGIAGAIVSGGNMSDVSDAIGQLNKQAEAYARSGFNKQLGELNSELERLNKGFKGGISDDLDREADALAEFADTGIINLERYSNAKLKALSDQFSAQGGSTQADRDEAALQALRNRIKVQTDQNNALKEYENVLRDTTDARQQDELSILSTTQAVEALTNKLAAQQQRFVAAAAMPSGLEKTKLITELTKDIAESERQIFKLTNSVRTASQEIASSFSGAFDSLSSEIADFVVDGEFKLSNFTSNLAKSIISTVTKLAIINPLLNGLFGGTKGWTSLPAFYADGGRPPVGRPSVVGEEGAELFIPDTAGTIIPHDASKSMLSGGGGGTTINIDARGSQMGVIQEIRAGLSHLNATFEDRATGAVMNARRRGGGLGRGLGA